MTQAAWAEVQADGGTVRVLDRMSDKVEDLALKVGTSGVVGKIMVTLEDCRYPEGEPSGSIAQLMIQQDAVVEPVFRGWMSAASPALNPMDHPRYDVWLLQCNAPEADQPKSEAEGSDG